MTTSSAPSRGDIETRLAALRDKPVDTSEGQNVLFPIFNYLVAIRPDQRDGRLHWFCPIADALTVEAATFLIRLFAYESENVEAWKKRFQTCLSGCCQCIQGFQEAKITSRHTYFDAFPDETIRLFYASFDQWEISMVLEALPEAGFSPEHSPAHAKLANVRPAIIYHTLSNLSILQDPRIISLLRSASLPEDFPDWPPDPPPPGLLLLMMDENPELRRWAQNMASKSQVTPIPRDKFTLPFVRVLASASNALGNSSISTNEPHLNLKDNASVEHSFASDRASLWTGFLGVLRLVPLDLLTANAVIEVDLRRLVTSHVHDVGPEFADILKAFILLLKRLGSQFWEGEQPKYPEVIFDAIKDNASYLELLSRTDSTSERSWLFAWCSEFLYTISGLTVHDDVLAKMVGFMCEELQHERFGDARPVVMLAATRLLSTAIHKSRSEEMSSHREATSRILSIHTDAFISVAFANSHNDDKWQTTRSKCREMILSLFREDTRNVLDHIGRVCRALAGNANVVIPALSVRHHLWTKAYKTLQPTDTDGLKMILSIVAQVAHLDNLNENVFGPAFYEATESRFSEVSKGVQEVNRSLLVIRDQLLPVVSRYANDSNTSAVLDLLRSPGVVKDIMMLMLSPVADVQAAAQTLVGQAFDVDVRLNCFRALLENVPDAALEGIFKFLDVFIRYAPAVPEACSLSKSLVRCLTDVIEVLCASYDGLLRNPHYLNPVNSATPGVSLLRLWNLMSKAIAVIFKRTPTWSRYFDSEDMIAWMRDALIFGRDMLAQRRVFEAAINRMEDPNRASKSLKILPATKQMIDDLQAVLPELARWLRLTDQELLHQSFSLLQSLLDCYRETGIPPSPAGIDKLTKHIDGARDGSAQSRLDASKLSKLQESLTPFIDEEVEVLSHTTVAQGKKPEERRPSTLDSKKSIALNKPEAKRVHGPLISQLRSSSKAPVIPRGDLSVPDRKRVLPNFQKMPPPLASETSAPFKRKGIVAKNEGASRITRIPDSSSDSESDPDEPPGSLKALGGYQRPTAIKQPTERRKVKMIGFSRNNQETMYDRREEARKTALRLRPDITGLHRVILSWNYDHAGPEPPTGAMKSQRLKVPDQFRDHAHYFQVFEPLLILECWSQIVQSKTEVKDSYKAKILSKQFVDDWIDLEIDISDTVKKDWYLTETDVVLFRHTERENCVLAKVRSYTARPWGIQAAIRCYAGPNGDVDPGLQINSAWRISKVFSLSTIHREYAALQALPYYQHSEIVLRPRLNKVSTIDDKDTRRLMTEYKVNEPQAIAISSALQTEGFALIQGPPGTGKTSTICGLVDVVLSRRPPPTTAVHVGRNSTAADKTPTKKVLLCAPSNAAIDELAYRISQLSPKVGNRKGSWKVVRIGADKSINISTREISLDFLIEQKMHTDEASSNNFGSAIAAAQTELEAVRRLVQQKKAEEAMVRDNVARSMALQNELKDLNNKRKVLSQNYDSLKDRQKSFSRSLDATRRRIRSEILLEADIICCTLSGSGQEILEALDFEMIVIDEAAQSIELSSLIPLRHNCKSCIMVGDPQQLPPTVLSQEASRFNYSQSLFVRLQRHRPDVVQLLSVQYRMHPDISQLPSRIFYDGRLVDGPDMEKATLQPWHSNEKFGTYRFYNVHKGREETTPSQSLKNVAEAQVAVALFQRLRREFSVVNLDFRVGVVSMYSAQVAELRRAFSQRLEKDIVEKIHFHTVDGFQGQEKDVIILSCVRAGPGLQNVGFLADTRRMNVALTRAKSSLFILGNAATLERSNETWAAIIRDSRSRSVLVNTEPSYFTAPPTVTLHESPVRQAKLAATQPPPENLLTPREIKASANIRGALMTTTDPRIRRESNPAQIGSAELKSELKADESKGQKRPLETEDDRATATTTSNSNAANITANAGRPPAKRPKPAPSIFIPKKPKQNKLP